MKKIVSMSKAVRDLSDAIYVLPNYFCIQKYMEINPRLWKNVSKQISSGKNYHKHFVSSILD